MGADVATRAAWPAPTPTSALTFTLPAGAKRAIVSGGPPPQLLKLADVRPGMVGEALTVFRGTKPEPFKVRVVAVLKQFLPKEDVILIRAEDPRVEHSGIVAGMSGSPVYVDGKLMGAIAYAWSFAKDPLGGVTPIES
ncbi:MAG TPA: SpoIVB peptidase S55 domain-containing protein, partial [Polyangia bacterium]|nr:SpoIVB peptidase S55 domain-containing protein [Polyangia bacterium]